MAIPIAVTTHHYIGLMQMLYKVTPVRYITPHTSVKRDETCSTAKSLKDARIAGELKPQEISVTDTTVAENHGQQNPTKTS
jgi:hypothetical protein